MLLNSPVSFLFFTRLFFIHTAAACPSSPFVLCVYPILPESFVHPRRQPRSLTSFLTLLAFRPRQIMVQYLPVIVFFIFVGPASCQCPIFFSRFRRVSRIVVTISHLRRPINALLTNHKLACREMPPDFDILYFFFVLV